MPSHQARQPDVTVRRWLRLPVSIPILRPVSLWHPVSLRHPVALRRPVALGLSISLAMLLAACSAATVLSPPAATVHLTGRATAGPVCPVERVPPDPACAPRPVPNATLIITTAAGIVVSQVRTAADGSFSFDLPDGSYRLVPQAVQGLMGGGQPIEFSVRVGGPPQLPLSVSYDTGIR